MHVEDFWTIGGGLIRQTLLRSFLRNRNVKAFTESHQRLVAELLFLVRRIACFRRSETIALHCLGENYRGSPSCFHGAFVSVVNLLRIVAAATQAEQIIVGHVLNQRQKLGIFPKEVRTQIGTAFCFEILVFPVDAFFHHLHQQAGLIASEEGIPIGAPNYFNDVPTGAAKGCFQLVDDLAIAAHRAIQALKIAVDDKD